MFSLLSSFSWRELGLVLSNILLLAYLVMAPQRLAASSSNDTSFTTEKEPTKLVFQYGAIDAILFFLGSLLIWCGGSIVLAVLIRRVCVRIMVKFTEWMAIATEAMWNSFDHGVGYDTTTNVINVNSNNTTSSPSSIEITQELLASSSKDEPTSESRNGAGRTTTNNSQEKRVQRDDGNKSACGGDKASRRTTPTRGATANKNSSTATGHTKHRRVTMSPPGSRKVRPDHPKSSRVVLSSAAATVTTATVTTATVTTATAAATRAPSLLSSSSTVEHHDASRGSGGVFGGAKSSSSRLGIKPAAAAAVTIKKENGTCTPSSLSSSSTVEHHDASRGSGGVFGGARSSPSGLVMVGGTISSPAAAARAPQGRGIPPLQQQQKMQLNPRAIAMRQQFELQIWEQRLVQLQQMEVVQQQQHQQRMGMDLSYTPPLLGYPPHPQYPNHAGGAVYSQQQQQQQLHLIRNSMLGLGSGGRDGGRGVVGPGGGLIHHNPRLNHHYQSDPNNRMASSLLHQQQFQQQLLPMDQQNPNTKLTNNPTNLAAVSAPEITEQEQQQVADAAKGAGIKIQTDETAAAATTTAATPMVRSKGDEEGGTNKKRKKMSTKKNCLKLTLAEKQQHKQQRQQRDQQKTMRKKQQESNTSSSTNTVARDCGGNDVDTDGLLRQVTEEAKLTITKLNQNDDTVEGSTTFTTSTCSSVGQDGNFNFCKSCGETGEVVCCDGCPHVYHPQCLPKDCESFAALDNQDDDEPWYCPLCIKNGYSQKNKTRTNKKGASTSSAVAAAETCGSPYRQNHPNRKRSHDADDEANDDETRATIEEDTVMTPSENAIRKNRQGLSYVESKSIVEKVHHCTKDDDDENDENDENEFLPSKVTPAPSAIATNSDQMMNSNKNDKNNHNGNNDAEDDVAVAAVTKRKSENQSRNFSPKKKSKCSIQENNNRNIINVDDDDIDDGIHGDDDGDDDSDKTNNHPRRNGRRATAKGKKKYIDDDNDDDDNDDDDDSEASFHDYEEEADESVVPSKELSSSKSRSISRRSSSASSLSSSSSSSSTCDDNSTISRRSDRSNKFQAEGEEEEERKQEEYEARPPQPEERKISTRDDDKKRTGIAKVTPSPRPPQRTHRRVSMSSSGRRKSTPGHRTSSRVATAGAAAAAAQTIKKKCETKKGNTRKRTNTASALSQNKNSKLEIKWNIMYGHLQQYKKKYHSTSVLRTFKDEDGCRLGIWVANQRQAYTNKSLSVDRIHRLESMGFHWSEQDAQWTKMYDRLVKYKKQNKSTCVPFLYPADPQLGQWVSQQRKCYKTKNPRLTVDRISQLDSIGFVWNAHDAQWMENYERLVAYNKQYKTTCVPRLYPADLPLGRWVIRQRSDYNTNQPSLTADRINRLDSIGFVWKMK